jgi:glycosylphosphatidylinositol transamidase (GPIT) subunit GPI8
MVELTSAQGAATGWDRSGVADTLGLLRGGELPNIRGATGDLDYGEREHTDLVASYYAPWRVEGSEFVLDEALSTDPDAHEGTAGAEGVFRQQGSDQHASLSTGSSAPPAQARTGLWALIVAGSSGWENYRHQADALAQYQLLRKAGLPDDRIVLVLADDIADAPENPEPGVVRHEVGGPNLYEDVHLDYELDDVTAPDILEILAGRSSDRLQHVIESTPSDNVYVYFSGHGSDQGMFIGADQAADRVAPGSFVSPEVLAATIDGMDAANRYRRLLVAVEMCEAGAMGTALTAPDALLIGAANAFESSLATDYAPRLGAWLGDQFSVAFTEQVKLNPTGSLDDLYRETYLDVSGSHVSAYNAANFSDLNTVAVSEFFHP